MIAGVRLIELRKARIAFPGEFAGIHDGTGNGGAVAAHVLGQRVHHDIGTVFKRPAQCGGCHRIIHHQRHTRVMGDLGQGSHVHHVARRVTDGFAEYHPGFFINGIRNRLGITAIGHAHLNALIRQGMREQVIGTAIKLTGGNNIVPGLRQCLDRRGDRRHT